MLMKKTRFGGNGGAMSAGLLPTDVRHGGAPLPSLTSAFSRRAALFGAVASTGFLAAAVAPVVAGKSGVGAGSADARLVALADEVVALYRHREDHLQSDEPHGRDTDAEETLGWAANVSQLALGPNTADGDLTAPERFGMGFVRCGADDHEPNGDAEPSLGRPEGFQFETGGDLDLERVDDGEDASHYIGELLFLPQASRQSGVAHA